MGMEFRDPRMGLAVLSTWQVLPVIFNTLIGDIFPRFSRSTTLISAWDSADNTAQEILCLEELKYL